MRCGRIRLALRLSPVFSATGEGEIDIVKGLNVPGRIKGSTVAVILALGLSSCGGALDSDLLQGAFWAGGPTRTNTIAELGMAELAKGNYIEAETKFRSALKRNPQDIHALLGLGMLYQNNGLTTRARQMYEALLAIRPDESNQFVVWKSLKTRPISEIASVNLALIESGGVLTSLGRESDPQAPAEPNMAATGGVGQPVSGAPSPMAMTARAMSSEPAGQAPFADAGLPRFAEADSNIVSRFKTLVALRDQGLVTQEEFNTRRQANIGALLPLSSPPPAAGLDRPVPSTEQISGRLRAIGRGLEMRAISVAQHSAERSMILDAMMPAAPIRVANPGRPPQGLLQAADSVRRLEQLREANLITSDEYARERAAIEAAMSPAPLAPAPAAAMLLPSSPAEMEAPVRLGGPQPAVHLASYRSRKDAERGWSQLRRAHKAELSGLQSEISKINLGAKGIFFRLKAGPLPDKSAADGLCRQLKARRQFCEVTFMNPG